MYNYLRTAKFDSDTVKEIAKLTDNNNHTEALIEGAKMVGATKLVKKLELVFKLQDLEGHMPVGLREYRDQLSKELDSLAKRDMSDEEFESFHGAF